MPNDHRRRRDARVTLFLAAAVVLFVGFFASPVGSRPAFVPLSLTSSSSVPSSASLADRVVPASILPVTFLDEGVDDGLVNAGGLESTGRRWVSVGPGPGEDDVTLSITRFASAEDAVAFNRSFSTEYVTMGPVLSEHPIDSIPESAAFTNGRWSTATTLGQAASTATVWFTVGPIAVSVYASAMTGDALRFAEPVAVAQYQLLT
jgi:hypothetical protein